MPLFIHLASDSIVYRYELQECGLLKYNDIGTVPDVYARNQELDQEIEFLKKETIKFKTAAL